MAKQIGPRRGGFTLVELLIVLAIIAVLLAILLPILHRASRAAEVVSFLQRAGFVVLPLHPAPPDLTKSVLLWGHGSGKQEAVLASYLTTLAVYYDNAHTKGAVQTVVIGPDFKGILLG